MGQSCRKFYIGIVGEGNLTIEFKKGTRVESNKKFMKFYTLHKSIMQRCYLKSSSGYKSYGDKGVTVAKEWHDLNYFFATIEVVDGYDFQRIVNGELQLDKDIKFEGNKVYSKENCAFVTPSQNSGHRPSNMRPFVAVAPDYTYKTIYNREEFCRKHKMNSYSVWGVLQRGRGTYKKWQFYYLSEFNTDKIVKRREYIATSPTGEKYRCEQHARFARRFNLSAANISMVLSGRQGHHKGWTFEELN